MATQIGPVSLFIFVHRIFHLRHGLEISSTMP